MYKSVTQDMNSKVIFELQSLVLLWNVILSLSFMYYTQVVEEQTISGLGSHLPKNIGQSASIQL